MCDLVLYTPLVHRKTSKITHKSAYKHAEAPETTSINFLMSQNCNHYDSNRPDIYLLKNNNKNIRKRCDIMFKVNNKNTRTM